MVTRSQMVFFASVIIAITGWINFAWLSADEPESNRRKTPPSAAPAESAPTPPTLPPPAIAPDDAVKDPLYQAIREQLKDGRPSLAPNEHQDTVQTPGANKSSVTDAEWKAVELMLRAARILDRSQARSDANNESTNHAATVKQLRASALQILRKELSQ